MEADGQIRPTVEPPIILALTGKEAAILINLLALECGPEARALGYRLIVKFIQAGYPGLNLHVIESEFNR